MGGDGLNDVSGGAGGMVNRTGLTSGSLARSGALAEVERFLEGEKGGLIRRSWVDGSEERIWKPSLRICLRW